jgi:hypothetical protein
MKIKERLITRRILIVCLVVAGVVITVTAFAIRARHKKQTTPMWTVESPNHTYRIVFAGLPASPSWPFTESRDLKNRRVTADISKNGSSLVQRALLYDGDAYDSRFEDLYPDDEWLSESILHLWQKNEAQNPRAIAGETVLSNESKQTLKYAYVHAGKTNLFLLFDVAPKSEIILPIRLQHWEEVIGCEGRYDDREVPYRSGDFSLLAPGKPGTHYKVRFDANGCSVTREN